MKTTIVLQCAVLLLTTACFVVADSDSDSDSDSGSHESGRYRTYEDYGGYRGHGRHPSYGQNGYGGGYGYGYGGNGGNPGNFGSNGPQPGYPPYRGGNGGYPGNGGGGVYGAPPVCPLGQIYSYGRCVPLNNNPVTPQTPSKTVFREPTVVIPSSCAKGQQLVNGKCHTISTDNTKETIEPACKNGQFFVDGKCVSIDDALNDDDQNEIEYIKPREE